MFSIDNISVELFLRAFLVSVFQLSSMLCIHSLVSSLFPCKEYVYCYHDDIKKLAVCVDSIV